MSITTPFGEFSTLAGVGEDCREATVLRARTDADGHHGVAAYALDPENAARLWELSERWVSVTAS